MNVIRVFVESRTSDKCHLSQNFLSVQTVCSLTKLSILCFKITGTKVKILHCKNQCSCKGKFQDIGSFFEVI